MPEMMKEVVLALDAESRELAQQLASDLRDLLAVAPEWARPLAEGISELQRGNKQQHLDALVQSIDRKLDALAKASDATRAALGLLTTQAVSMELARKITADIRELLAVTPAWSKGLVDSITELRDASNQQKTESSLQAILNKTEALARASANASATLATLASSTELSRVGRAVETLAASATSAAQMHNRALSEAHSTTRRAEERIEALAALIESTAAAQQQAEHDRASGLERLLREQSEQLGAVERTCAALTTALTDQNTSLSIALERLTALEGEAKSSAALLNRLNRPWYRRIFGG